MVHRVAAVSYTHLDVYKRQDGETVFDAIVPEYLAGLVYGGVCESTASELAARRMAMDAATSNAEEMIDQLNLCLLYTSRCV